MTFHRFLLLIILKDLLLKICEFFFLGVERH